MRPMLRRRLGSIAAAASLLASVVTIALVCIARDRVEQTRLAAEASFQVVSHRIQEVERESAAYEKRIGRTTSVAELEHLNALGDTNRRLIVAQNNAVALILSPHVPPPAYRRAITFTATLSVAWLLLWAGPRLRGVFPGRANLPDDVNKKIMYEVERRAVRHWLTYAGLVVMCALVLGIWYVQNLLWPQADHGGLGFLIESAAVTFSTAIAFAIFIPALSRDFRRELAARGFCPSCGYDLRATPARCPECNWRVSEGRRYGDAVSFRN